jgi:hypothetical protein
MDLLMAFCSESWVYVTENQSYSTSLCQSLPLPDKRLERVSNIELQDSLASYLGLNTRLHTGRRRNMISE